MPRWLGVSVLVAACALGCGGGNPEPDETVGTLEYFSWWTAGGEADALQAVIDLHAQKYPRVTVENVQLCLGTCEYSTLKDRMAAGEPPDLFQASIGQDLLQFATDPPSIEPLNDIAQERSWHFYDELLKVGNLSAADGNLYAVPVNIHRINSLFINLPVLQRNGVDPATLGTLDGLHTALATLSADTSLLAPMTIGSKDPWTLDILMFQTVLPSVAGGRAYEEYFRGQRVSNDPMIQAMLDETATLWTYMPTGPNAPTQVAWIPAIDQFVAGQVAMTVMGDWAKGLIDAGGLEPGVDYDEIPFPSATGITETFVYTADAFAVPVRATRQDLAFNFLDTLVSDEAQVAFNTLTGSIPSRSLPATAQARFDSVTQRTIQAFENAADRRVALSAIVPWDYNGPIDQPLFDYVTSCEAGICDSTIVLSAMADNYALLQQ